MSAANTSPRRTSHKANDASTNALAALRALDRIFNFSKPNSLYVFSPSEDPKISRAWKKAANVIAAAKR